MGQRLQCSSRSFLAANQTSFASWIQFHAFSTVSCKLLLVLPMYSLLPHIIVSVQTNIQCLLNSGETVQLMTTTPTSYVISSKCQINHFCYSNT